MTVSMHLLVLSAFRLELYDGRCAQAIESQCTFWCSVLSDLDTHSPNRSLQCVSMHLLVLSAFRLHQLTVLGFVHLIVSMHLLVLSAFRRRCWGSGWRACWGVSMHLLVLSAFRQSQYSAVIDGSKSQCTFWCSVLSDGKPTF